MENGEADISSGFVQVTENLERHGIKNFFLQAWKFMESESHGKLKILNKVTAHDKARTMEDQDEKSNSARGTHFGENQSLCLLNCFM